MTELVQMCGKTYAVTRRADGVDVRCLSPALREPPKGSATVIHLEVLEAREAHAVDSDE